MSQTILLAQTSSDTHLKSLHVISEPASVGVPQLVGKLIGSASNQGMDGSMPPK
jgi:hypothetical protein